MSGRKARQWRQARQRLASIVACDCGCETRIETNTDGLEVLLLGCHSMECAFLRFIAGQPWCSQCGHMYRTRGNQSIGWYRRWCPNGHMHEAGYR